MRNVFILGAGSSHEYGMPLWKELKGELDDVIMRCAGQLHVGGDVFRASRFAHQSSLQGDPENSLEIYKSDKVAHHLQWIIKIANNNSTVDYALKSYLDELAIKIGTDGRHRSRSVFRYIESIFWILIEKIFKEYDKKTNNELVNSLFGLVGSKISEYTTITQTKNMIEKSEGWFKRYYELMDKKTRSFPYTDSDIFIDFNYDSLIFEMLRVRCIDQAMLDEINKSLSAHNPTDKQRKYATLFDLKRQQTDTDGKLDELLQPYNGNDRLMEINGLSAQQDELENRLDDIDNAMRPILDDLLWSVQYNDDGTPKISKSKTLNYFQPHGYFNFTHSYSSEEKLWTSEISHRGHEPTSCYDVKKQDVRLTGIYEIWKKSPTIDNLIVLGVGTTALRQNLDKLRLNNIEQIGNIWFTCKDENPQKYIDYFSNVFKGYKNKNPDDSIKKHIQPPTETCNELMQKIIDCNALQGAYDHAIKPS